MAGREAGLGRTSTRWPSRAASTRRTVQREPSAGPRLPKSWRDCTRAPNASRTRSVSSRGDPQGRLEVQSRPGSDVAASEKAGVLIMLVGRPASGKSFLGRQLADQLEAELLQTDALRKAMFQTPTYSGREHAAVYAAAHRRIARALRAGQALIFDATNLAERARQRVYRLADEAEANLVIVLVY